MSAINILITIGIATMVSALIYIGKKLQILDDLQVTTNKIKTNLKVVSDYLTTTNVDFNEKELQSYSPLTLTSEGEQLVKSLGFDKAFKKNKADFFQYIDAEEPRLKYDVENAAIRSVKELYDQDYMEFLKIFFYNSPDRNLQNVAPTLGVYIRDKYLAEHPKISK